MATSTERKVKWAVDLFNEWKTQRNIVADADPTLSPIHPSLDEMTKDELNYSLSRFICEIKKKNGDEYPGETLHEIVICMQLHFELTNKSYKFLSDPDFLQIKNTLDGQMKHRAKSGLGGQRKQAGIITIEEEEEMWRQGVLGTDNPTKLVNTLLYRIGLNFALRGGQEHRDLKWKNSQIKLISNKKGEFLRYSEDVSKSNQGGLKHRKVKQKVVDAYENKRDRSRCIVTIFKKYEYHCPPEDVRPDAFYLRPLSDPKNAIWFAAQPLGRHKLAQVVSNLCKNAGLPGYRTNHSLRASAATRMFDQQVDEQLICEITGHRSNAVRNYKRTSETLKRKVNAVVQGTSTNDDDSKSPSKKVTRTLNSTIDDGDRNITLTLNLNF